MLVHQHDIDVREIIKELKENIKIPVIGNGDVKSPDGVMRMMEETGCDGVMVGRSALGNPWFFRDAIALYKGETVPPEPTILDKVSHCRLHFDHMVDWHGERIATNLIRKHFGWYIRGFNGASPYRKALVSAPDREAMVTILDSIQ